MVAICEQKATKFRNMFSLGKGSRRGVLRNRSFSQHTKTVLLALEPPHCGCGTLDTVSSNDKAWKKFATGLGTNLLVKCKVVRLLSISVN
jgi:hypothetical protein